MGWRKDRGDGIKTCTLGINCYQAKIDLNYGNATGSTIARINDV